MRRLSLVSLMALTAIVLITSAVSAETWKIDPNHSTVSFKVRHLFSKVSGQFTEWEGTIGFDTTDPSATAAKVSIVSASVDTGNEQRDKHLRSGDFFNAEEFPSIEFTSTKVVKHDGQWVIHGDLTIHGVTKSVEMPFAFLGAGADPWGGQRAGFSASTKINRKDFGIEWNKALDQGGMVLGEEVEIEIEIEAIAAPAGR
jgi:polyisoprenoid-binding protein YceI